MAQPKQYHLFEVLEPFARGASYPIVATSELRTALICRPHAAHIPQLILRPDGSIDNVGPDRGGIPFDATGAVKNGRVYVR